MERTNNPYFGFHSNDYAASRPLSVNTFTHIIFTFATVLIQLVIPSSRGDGYRQVYVNGVFVGSLWGGRYTCLYLEAFSFLTGSIRQLLSAGCLV